MRLLVIFLLVPAFIGCGTEMQSNPTTDPSVGEGDKYFEGKSKWHLQKENIASYQLSILAQWGLGDSRTTVSVELPSNTIIDCMVSSRIGMATPSTRLCEPYERKTVDDLFTEIERTLSSGPYQFSVQYDPILGFPRQIAVDGKLEVADDEGVSTIDLVILP